MKKKYGPLPLWAWVVIVGGTIGIYLYRKNSGGSSTSSSSIDPATGLTYAAEAADQAAGLDPLTGQPYSSETPSGTGGGGSGGGSTGTGTDPFQQVDPATGQTYASELLGGQGLTDPGTPVQTFAGEVTDVASGLSALQQLGSLFGLVPANTRPKLTGAGALRAPSGPDKPAAKKGYTIRGLGNGNWEYVPVKKKRSNGSGAAGHTHDRTPTRRTVQHKPKPAPAPRHVVPTPTRVHGGKHKHR